MATTTPRILVNDTPRTSEATDTLLPTTPTVYSEHNEYLATKLDRLHDKKERYISHQEFLNRCLENDIVPIGLQLELEPTIGNHNDEFLNKWHTKLKEFSMKLMKDVIEFCIDTDTETSNEINKIALKLKGQKYSSISRLKRL